MRDRSLVLDSADHPHVAYGDDHLYYAWHDGTTWQYETVDPDWGVGSHAALALDENGHPHISYYDATNEDLRYAHYDGLAWLIQTVDHDGEIGLYTSIALDSGGHPHISYLDATNYDLKYAHYSGTAWQIQVVDSVDDVGLYTSIALDGANRPHISYYDDTHEALKYALYDGAAWQIETVDDSSFYQRGLHASLALDAAGRPHVSYCSASAYHYCQGLYYAHHDGAAWQIQEVDGSGNAGWYSSLALDANDLPRISYLDGHANYDLRYAFYDGSSWQIAIAESGGDVGYHTSLAIDSAGRPHISYCAQDHPDTYVCLELKYARMDPSAWHVETVDVAGEVGRYSSLALDTADQPHVAYFDGYPHYDLKYARHNGTEWQFETIDSTGDVGRFASLAMDSADRPHVGYCFYTCDPLCGCNAVRHAYFDGTAWITETVESGDRMGYWISLALDADDRPHLSYDSDGGLRYAHFDVATWITETVDGSGGLFYSIAIDSAGHPHISYHYASANWLNYAHYDGTVWQIETVDSNWAGDSSSLKLDSHDLPHIAYYGADLSVGDTVKYASWDGSTWQIDVIDSGLGLFGSYAALDLDGADFPHVSYYDNVADKLCYAHFDGSFSETAWRFGRAELHGAAWITETVDSTAVTGLFNAIALDKAGTPHISYYNQDYNHLQYAYWGECVPVEAVEIAGSPALPVGVTGLYEASYEPLTATTPVFAWDNGAVGPTATYSWTLPGDYTVQVTATNGCGQAQGSLPVTVYCQPVEEVQISGPASLPSGAWGLYTATSMPPTATLPTTFVWDNGTVGPTAAYSWTTPGRYTVTVTATNDCGQFREAYSVTVFCQPVEEAGIRGPLLLPTGITGLYEATYAPPSTSLPITFTWDNGTLGPTAAYSWTTAGAYTIALTASNDCGEVQAATGITVHCQPVIQVQIDGPDQILAGRTGQYLAVHWPLTASPPITFAWDNGTSGAEAVYSWPEPGSYIFHVTATNACGWARGSRLVQVRPVASKIYLPLVSRK